MKAQGVIQITHNHIRKAFGRLGLATGLVVIVAVLAACGGPRMMRLTDQRFSPLDPQEKVGVYIGKVNVPCEPIAMIDSEAFSTTDKETRSRQIEQLRIRARKLGANAVQQVVILPKKVRGFSVDERTPFESWKQGEYELYFMRGMAIHLTEEEPANLEEIEPTDGWLADSLPVPPRLEQPLDKPLAGPGPRTQ